MSAEVEEAINHQYNMVCGPRLQELCRMTSDIHKAMFVGNGTPAWHLRIDRNTQLLRGLLWMTGSLVFPIVVGAVVIVVTKFMG